MEMYTSSSKGERGVNSKSEARNPKQSRNSNTNNPKQKSIQKQLHLAKIINTNLKNADFSGAEIYSAVFSQTDILEAIGLYQLKKMMVSKRLVLKRLGFEVFDDHFIAYRTFNYFRNSPKKWRLELGSTIKEHINNDVWRMCSRGINVGTKEWCEVNCNNKNLFQLRIPFTAEICIPIWSDGKIRVSEAKIIGNQDNLYTWQ